MRLPGLASGLVLLICCLLFAQRSAAIFEAENTSDDTSLNKYRLELEQKIESAMILGDSRGISLLEQAQRTLPAGLNKLDTSLGNLYHKTGVLHYINGNFSQAIGNFSKALPVRQYHSHGDVLPLLNTLNGLTQSHMQLLHYDTCETLIEMQLALMDQFNYQDGETRADLYLADARLAYAIDDYSRCREKLLLSQELYQKCCAQAFNYGIVLNMLGVTSDLLNEPESAVAFYNQALNVFSIHQDPQNKALTWHNLGMAYSNMSDYEKAKQCFRLAYEIHGQNRDSIELARCFAEMAKVESKLGRYDQAEEQAKSSLDIRKRALPAWHPDVLESQLVVGEVYMKMAITDSLNREVWHSRAKAYFDEALEAALGSPRADLAIMPLVNLAMLEADAGFSSTGGGLEAHRLFLKADSLIQRSRIQYRHQESKIDFTRRVRRMYAHAIRNALRLFDASGNPAFFSDAMSFSDRSKSTAVRDRLQKQAALNYTNLPDSVVQLQRQLHLQLGAATQAVLAVSDQSDSLYLAGLKALEDVKYRMEELDEAIEQAYPRYYDWLREPQQQVTLSQLQSTLRNGSVLLEFFIGDDRIHIFGVSAQRFGHWEVFDAAASIAAVNRFVKAIETSDRLPADQVRVIANQTFRLLLEKPLLFFNPDETISNLKIVPDGLIGKLPFDALVTEQSLKEGEEVPYLIRRYSHSLLYSSRLLAEQHQIKRSGFKSRSFSVFGIDYMDSSAFFGNSEYTGLPFVQDEVNEVAAINNADLFLNSQATLSMLRNKLENDDMLHIAVHGTFDEGHAGTSGLIFSKAGLKDSQPNILTIPAIYGLQASADFVYLSSCFSGKGEVAASEGVMSLSRAFTYAGVKSQVITLWEVSDRASAMIAAEFYRQLKKGKEKDEALRQAKLHYLGQSVSAIGQTPFYWAGSVVVGSSEALYYGFSWIWYLFVVCVICLLLIGFWRYVRRKRMRLAG